MTEVSTARNIAKIALVSDTDQGGESLAELHVSRMRWSGRLDLRQMEDFTHEAKRRGVQTYVIDMLAHAQSCTVNGEAEKARFYIEVAQYVLGFFNCAITPTRDPL